MRKFSVELAGNREVALWRRAECNRSRRYARRKVALLVQLLEDWEMYWQSADQDDWFRVDCWCCNQVPGPGDQTVEDIGREDVVVLCVHGWDGLDAACTVPVMGDFE